MVVLAALPLAFFVTCCFLLFSSRTLFTFGSWRLSFLVSATIFGAGVTLSTELLSLLRWVAPAPIVALWILQVASAWFLVRRKPRVGPVVNAGRLRPRWDFAFVSGASVGAIAAILAAIAALAPPNNWDSMVYHMSRVQHWVQNQSVAHYPTHIIRQLYLGPFAEFVLLHLQLLTGGDRLANLVQWFSMLGSCVGVSVIAEHLRGGRSAQILSALVCVTIPMGLLQATSTQNDYVTAFMLVSFVAYALAFKRSPSLTTVALAGAAIGLATLTKATAYIYAFPLVVWIGVIIMRLRCGWRRRFWLAAVPTALFLLLNTGQFVRNQTLFGAPLGVSAAQNNIYTNEVMGPGALASNVIRNAAMHLQVPVAQVRSAEQAAVERLHRLVGLDVNDRRTTFAGAWFSVMAPSRHEDTAGNLVHLLLLLLCLALMLTCPRRFISQPGAVYGLCLLSAYLLFCLTLKWQVWHSRLHLPLFVLWAPLMATALTQRLGWRLVKGIALVLLLQSSVWLLGNKTRPIAARQNVFNTSREEQVFRNRPPLRDGYSRAADVLEAGAFRRLGLEIGGGDWEYPLWVMFRIRQRDMTLRHTDVRNVSSRLDREAGPFDAIIVVDNQENRVEVRPRAVTEDGG